MGRFQIMDGISFFVSTDLEQLKNFMHALRIEVFIGSNLNGSRNKTITRVQFGDVLFYKFLLDIGLMSNKSKIIGKIEMPQRYFFDFLRGSFDGDGSTYSYFDPRWKQSFMFYTTFVSASKLHIDWLREEIFSRLAIRGHITRDGKKSTLQLKYAKKDSLKLLRAMYPTKKFFALYANA